MDQILISIGVFFNIATVLILINGKPAEQPENKMNLSFDELLIDYSDLPTLETYSTRSGDELSFRHYPANTDTVLVLLHGSGWHSQIFLPLARYLSIENIAQVYTPDLRGHGVSPVRRGDIDYIDQYEDDLADLFMYIRERHPGATLILGGHSSGGGLVIRFAGSEYGKEVDAYLLLSPFLKYNAPTIRPNSGGWAAPHTPRIIGLSMLNSVGIKFLNHLDVIDFNMPEAYRDGTETLTYSHRLNTGYSPKNYKKDLMMIDQKLLLIAGLADESFIAEAFQPEVSKYKQDAEVILVEGVSHMGIVIGPAARPLIKAWITDL